MTENKDNAPEAVVDAAAVDANDVSEASKEETASEESVEEVAPEAAPVVDSEIKVIDSKVAEEKIENGSYHARSILEIVGKPQKHVEETLLLLLRKISENDKYELMNYTVEPAEKVEGSDGLYSTFADLEFLAPNAVELMNFVIDYTPASVEVVHPSSLNVQASFLSNMLTELVGRLHLIDGEFRKVVAKSKVLSGSLSIMIQNSIMILLNLGPRTMESISKTVGVKEDQAKVFLDKLVSEEKISFDEESKKYALPKK